MTFDTRGLDWEIRQSSWWSVTSCLAEHNANKSISILGYPVTSILYKYACFNAGEKISYYQEGATVHLHVGIQFKSAMNVASKLSTDHTWA